MRKHKRLTPAQLRTFLNVAEHWGRVFEVYSSYSYLLHAGVVEAAHQVEIDQHYEGVRAELDRVAGVIRAAVDAGRWEEVKALAGNAHYLQEVLSERDDTERNKWWIVSALGRELADKHNREARANA